MENFKDTSILDKLMEIQQNLLPSQNICISNSDIEDLVEAVDDLDSTLSEMKWMFMSMTYKIEKIQNILVKNGVYEKYKENNCGGYQD